MSKKIYISVSITYYRNDSCNYRLEDSDNNRSSNNEKDKHRKIKVIW